MPIESATFSAIFRATAAPLVLYARQWLDRGEAEDVVQEAFIRLLEQRHMPENARAWLFRCVRNGAISRQRAHQRRRRREQQLAQTRSDWFLPDADAALNAAAVQDALQHLPPDQREIVVLRIWGQMTLQEIADLTGIAMSTVHRQYQSALVQMRRAMEAPCKTT